MTKKERYKGVVDYFLHAMPEPETELVYNNPYELLVAVILSAQCTDKRVNLVTPRLFAKYNNANELAAATPEEIHEYIKSISYPNNKAKHLAGMARMLVTEFAGTVPREIDQLVKLPGVGRKTANVIASVIFNDAAMAVDTHVYRVSHRLGLSNGKTPLAVEKDLVKNLPKDLLHHAHHWLILHGRYICVARKPKCPGCGLRNLCLYFEKNGARLMQDALANENFIPDIHS